MTQIIADLWNGSIAPCENCGSQDPEIHHLVGLMEKNRADLTSGLTAAQKEALQKYLDCSEEYLLRMQEQAFCDGFCLAGRLLSEIFSEHNS